MTTLILNSIPGLIENTVDVVLSGLHDKNAYVRKASVMAAYKLHVTSPAAANGTGDCALKH